MKKLVIMAMVSLSISGIAQKKRSENNRNQSEFTPKQKSELMVKKLTLELDLNAKQQKAMSDIITEQQLKREALRTDIKNKRAENKKLTSDEKFVLKNQVLDEKIALKNQLKKILTPEQLAKWEKIPKHNMKRQNRALKRKTETKK